jgi:hypothetical protein
MHGRTPTDPWRRLERNVMPHLSAIKAKPWMTTVMADDQYADRFFANEAK